MHNKLKKLQENLAKEGHLVEAHKVAHLRVRTNPVELAVALGLLNQTALSEPEDELDDLDPELKKLFDFVVENADKRKKKKKKDNGKNKGSSKSSTSDF